MTTESRVNGKEWVHPRTGEVRTYYQTKDVLHAIGYDWGYYNTGNIAWASLNGETISNCEMRRILQLGKVWRGGDGTLHIETDYMRGDARDAVKSRIEQLLVAEASE